jgi:hypothetical protein
LHDQTRKSSLFATVRRYARRLPGQRKTGTADAVTDSWFGERAEGAPVVNHIRDGNAINNGTIPAEAPGATLPRLMLAALAVPFPLGG